MYVYVVCMHMSGLTSCHCVKFLKHTCHVKLRVRYPGTCTYLQGWNRWKAGRLGIMGILSGGAKRYWRCNSRKLSKDTKPKAARVHVKARGRGAWASLAHGLQCLCDGRACCPPRAMQLVICRSWGFTVTVTLLLQLVIFTGKARVGVKIPQDGNRANRYGHVAVVHEHDWRTLCSVCATCARVA